MKVAIVQEWIISVGGSDKVVKAILDVFPDAHIYTLVAKKEICDELGIDYNKVTTSIIQKLPFGVSKHRMYLPLFPYAIEQFDLREYDVIISSSHAVAKGVLTKATQLHISYCHSPIRYCWDMYQEYLIEANLTTGIKSFFTRLILHSIRKWDVLSSNRVDYFISNSNNVKKRIKKTYRREATTIYPNIDIDGFKYSDRKEDFYFTCSRLVGYKKVGTIVEAFNLMPDKTLIIIGDGPDFKKIQKIANSNIKLLGYQSFEILRDYMQRARAFVFAANEDFGMIPLESQASGTPVIAYGVGGSLETVIEGETGVYFYEQTPSAIKKAVEYFEQIEKSLDYQKIRKHAEKFSEERFKREIKLFVENKYQEFITQE